MVQQYKLPELPYDLDALEPVISAEIMSLHYNKHHNGYVTNLNKALEQYAEAEKKEDLPAQVALQQAIKFNGGGHINHSIFWTNLAPKDQGGGRYTDGSLEKLLVEKWGSVEKFIEDFSAQATALQGSGWVWLGYNKGKKCLRIVSCNNQDPLSTQGLIPILGIDVWEHAYYLQYKNVRADYVKAIWGVINWANLEERYREAIA